MMSFPVLSDEDWALLSEDMRERGLTDDAFLGGQLQILQPKIGYRAAMDAVLLAAATPALENSNTPIAVLDVGCGVGTAGFCYLNRVGNAVVTGLELQSDLSSLSRLNAKRNGLSDRYSSVNGDLSDKRLSQIAGNSFDIVMTNPPYLASEKANNSPDAIRQKANFESHITLEGWINLSLKKLKQKGWFSMIQRADRLDEILAILHGKIGEITVIPLWPAAGQSAKRVIIRGRKAVKGGTIMHPGLILHEEGKRYTPAAESILWAGEPLQ